MSHRKRFEGAVGWWLVMAAFLLVSGLVAAPGWASGGKAAGGATLESVTATPAACAQPAVNGERLPFDAPEGGSCKAEPKATEFLQPEPTGGRTCRCSCGYPCKTDADCGGGIGSCRGGISCC